MMNNYNRENLIMKIASLNAELEHLLGKDPKKAGKPAPVKAISFGASSKENAHFLMMEELLNYSRRNQN